MKHLLLAASMTVGLPAYAQALQVYNGCAVPAVKPGRHTFYVDPVNGSMKGDGSIARPWRTLAEVLNPANKLVSTQSHKVAGGTDPLTDINPSAPIKAGDVIMLKTGNHGIVQFSNFFNKDFITIMPAPGQTPVINALQITSSGKWMFQGLKFMPETPALRVGGLIAIGYGDWQGTTHDVILDNNSISTTDNTSGWSGSDWMNKTQPYGVFFRLNTQCGTVTNNHIYNVLNGIAAAATQSLIQGNLIDKIFNDGIDVGTSNILIKNNNITGGTNNTKDDAFHADGIQGFVTITKNGVQTNKNVTIDGNTITKTGDANITYMQGITIFDGKWDNLLIQNNVITTNHWNALVVYGATNSTIINNTVIATDPINHPSWIQVRNAKDGSVSSNITVRNNIATQLSISGQSMHVDNNIAAQSIVIPGMTSPIRSGSVGTKNVVNPSITSQFVTFAIPTAQFNMRPKPTSAAIGFGSPVLMPAKDITGAARVAPVTAGAYAK